MQKDTIDILAQQVVRTAVKAAASDVEALTISEMLGDELPGLDSDLHEKIYDRALEYLKYTVVHVDIDRYRMEEVERGLEFNAQPEQISAVW